MDKPLQAPFPYFGGKAAVADLIWRRLGEVGRYIEPFFGSGAVLLARSNWQPGMDEIVNDKDCYVANVWRSLQFSPDETAKWCDWPVNHVDLTARKVELLKRRDELKAGLASSPNWHDPILAGYWIWAASCWIATGLTRLGQIPHLTDNVGVHKLSQIPQQIEAQGVTEPYNTNIYRWFRQISERLRYVKVTCGNWDIVCGGNWQTRKGICGIFFDPPYSAPERYNDLYDVDDSEIAKEVAQWSLERGKLPKYRIVLAGYYEEHEWLLQYGWNVDRWKAGGGYANRSKKSNPNRYREALFSSPHCIKHSLWDTQG